MEIIVPQDQRTDEELIAASNTGDSAAFEVLYYRYRDWVVNLAWRFTGDHQMSLDVLQETFLYFVNKFPGFVLTCRLKSFLYPVVKHLSLSLRKKEQRFENDETCLHSLEAPKESLPNERHNLSEALSALTDEHREVLLMRFVDELSLNEISQALEIPLGTVKSRLHNALKILRNDPRTKKLFLP